MAMVKYLFAAALVALCIIEIECKTFHNYLYYLEYVDTRLLRV